MLQKLVALFFFLNQLYVIFFFNNLTPGRLFEKKFIPHKIQKQPAKNSSVSPHRELNLKNKKDRNF